MVTSEQIIASNKAALNNAFALSNEAFASVEKLVELNLTAARSSLTESSDFFKSLLSAKDPQQFFTLQAEFFQPLAEKSVSYTRHVYEITSESGAELGKAVEAKAVEAQKQLVNFIDSALKNAPAGSESAVAVLKQVFNASQTAAESVQKVVKQATDLAESNFNAVTESATKATKVAAKKR
ncbi:MAG: TIGR01841 family phasin [Burkholderiales bacterium]|jgi:phasin family protein|nr:TIGR01841 family phasin [Burkholderiales bacterium]